MPTDYFPSGPASRRVDPSSTTVDFGHCQLQSFQKMLVDGGLVFVIHHPPRGARKENERTVHFPQTEFALVLDSGAHRLRYIYVRFHCSLLIVLEIGKGSYSLALCSWVLPRQPNSKSARYSHTGLTRMITKLDDCVDREKAS
ncbi:hypothetical protein [Rhodoferax antarcticus]|uniref:hypothetical protein n=1 Tax=Rhodoferax antarcticus TaxID=81479 RepID=UPI00139024D8|nr:hypothetical protein [Rhodoferax antarcticus]